MGHLAAGNAISISQSPLCREVYVKMTPGYEEKYPITGVSLVSKLKRSLCDLRQSPLNWCDHSIYAFLNDNDISKMGTTTDKSYDIATTIGKRNVVPILTLYLDSMNLLGGNKAVLDMLKGKT